LVGRLQCTVVQFCHLVNASENDISGKLLINESKHSEETQTLCAGCSKAEPKIFTPPQTQFRVIMATDPQTHKQTHTNRQYRLQYTAPQLAHSVIITDFNFTLCTCKRIFYATQRHKWHEK